LVSRNLAILSRAGFLAERRQGKLKFFRIRNDISSPQKAVLKLLARSLKDDPHYLQDLTTLKECTEFQKKVGRCDMKTFQEFQKWRKKNNDTRI
jgi:hypothetical protein